MTVVRCLSPFSNGLLGKARRMVKTVGAVMRTKSIAFGLLILAIFCGETVGNGQEWGSFPYIPACLGNGCATVRTAESVPYFALHPPVYYSYRVARTYGFSPFAYPPCFTPSSEESRGSVQSPSSGESRERQPLRIDNPFVEQTGGHGTATNQRQPGRKPQVVYPAMLARGK
jgi:hypothetical protein